MFKLLRKTPSILKKNKIIKLQNIIQKRNYMDNQQGQKLYEKIYENVTENFDKYYIVSSGVTFCVTELIFLAKLFSSDCYFVDFFYLFVISFLVSVVIAMLALPTLCMAAVTAIITIPFYIFYRLIKN